MSIESTAVKEDLNKRLRRIEGQVRGIQRMLDADRECKEIVQQLNAVQAALRNTTAVFVRTHARECLLNDKTLDVTQQQMMVDDLVDLMTKIK